MIKLIISDMDGTLLNNNDEIHTDFEEILKDLTSRGILFCVASGRQYYNLLDKFREVQEQIVFVAENGTYVVYKGEELLLKTIDSKLAYELIEVAENIKESYTILCGKKSAYIIEKDSRFIREVAKYYTRYKIVESFKEVQDDILKVTICDFEGAEKNSYKYYEKYKELVQITVSGKIWLDMTAKEVNKGVAIREIQERLGIDYRETMAFGDYLNDLELMDSAYHSYAMENAHEELKRRAKFIAKSNEENGVLEMIREHLEKYSK